MEIDIAADCPKCGVKDLTLEVQSAAHDDQLLDLVIGCGNCCKKFNAFIPISDFQELE